MYFLSSPSYFVTEQIIFTAVEVGFELSGADEWIFFDAV